MAEIGSNLINAQKYVINSILLQVEIKPLRFVELCSDFQAFTALGIRVMVIYHTF